MKYIKTFESLKDWNKMFEKLTRLLKIIGFKAGRIDGPDSKYEIDLNLIGVKGSISYCLMQQLAETLNKPWLIKTYKNEDDTKALYPCKDKFTAIAEKINVNGIFVSSTPEEAYTEIINKLINRLSKYTHDIIKIQIKVLSENTTLNETLNMDEDTCKEIISIISTYSNPHYLFNMIKNYQGYLYIFLKHFIGIQTSADMGEMGF